jgi:predicted ribosomally synthesized peptide with SipW-like signal peptide
VPVRAALALGTVLCVGVTGTLAYWSDEVQVSGTEISTGTLDLTVNGADPFTAFTTLSLTNMVPGNTTAGVLTVRNAGTVPLKYYADAAAGGTLGSALTVKVSGDAATTGSAPTKTCAGSALAGTGSGFTSNLVGTNANQRSLAVGASETLCIQATLPTTAPSALQTQTTNVTLTFNSTQVI